MNLRHLTDQCLLADTKQLVKQERELLTVILHHLREIERRRLFGAHPSLHVYAEKELGYSASQAHRRVTAARLFTEMPEIEHKIEAGEINLSHVLIADVLFKHEKKRGRPLTIEAKREVFSAIENTSTRQAEGIVNTFATDKIRKQDFMKALGDGRHLFTGEFTDDVVAKLEKLKGLLAHVNPNPSVNDLVDQALNHALEQLNPAKPTLRKANPDSRAEIRRQIWLRDQCRCTACGSEYAVQEDHIVPAAMGGEYTLENMRLLCRSCNQRAAIEKLGLDKMEPFLSRKH